jgi:hypothetical protein
MTPPIPDGKCPYCGAPIPDLFAEWTAEYQTSDGKRAIMAGDVVFDCYYCQAPVQLVLPLEVVRPDKGPGEYMVAKRSWARCEDWLRSQHPGESLSEVLEKMGLNFAGTWAFDGYNWQEGGMHHHRSDKPPSVPGANP